jgi:hypothetical protein
VTACRRATGTEVLIGVDGQRTDWESVAGSAAGAQVHLQVPDHGDPAGLGALWDGRPGERVILLNPSAGSAVAVLRPDPVWSCQVVTTVDPGLAAVLRGEAPADAARSLAAAIREATATLTVLGLDRPDGDVRARLALLAE